MGSVEIKRVETKADLKTFVEFHYDLYEGNEYDAPNLFSDEMFTLDKKLFIWFRITSLLTISRLFSFTKIAEK